MMTEKKKRLGRGLDTLIPEKKERPVQKSTTGKEETKQEAQTKESNQTAQTKQIRPDGFQEEKINITGEMLIKINKIEPSREQPRKKFDEKALLELADSIRQFGVLQPLIVQKKEDYYEIIAGERRWRAAKLAGIKEVPAIIKNFTDREAVEISLIENIQREDLSPVEEALAYKRLMDEFDLKQDEIAEKVSKSRTAVTNSIRLLKLSRRIQQMITDGLISAGHARALLGLETEDEEEQYMTAVRIYEENLSVRETESLIKKLNNPRKPKNIRKNKKSVIYEDLEQKIESLTGTKVTIKPKANGSGKIEIEYYSEEELEHIFEIIASGSRPVQDK